MVMNSTINMINNVKMGQSTGRKQVEREAKYEPNPPKRALSAFMFFSQDWRERIKIEKPDACFGEVGKLLGAKWKELDDEGKKSYIEQAAKDKERYENEKSAYHSFAPQPSSEVAESLGIDEAYPSSSTSSTVIKPPVSEASLCTPC
ncbi:high mobility group box domain-containing protein [Crassisporium funariophilum]|nr:high mobility group box domain-containing protein [Crassisporium funariophilum]